MDVKPVLDAYMDQVRADLVGATPSCLLKLALSLSVPCEAAAAAAASCSEAETIAGDLGKTLEAIAFAESHEDRCRSLRNRLIVRVDMDFVVPRLFGEHWVDMGESERRPQRPLFASGWPVRSRPTWHGRRDAWTRQLAGARHDLE